MDPELGLRARTVPMSALQEQPGESKDSYVEGGGSGTSGSVDVCTPLVGAVEPTIVTGRTPAKADRTPRTRAASVPSSNDDGVVAGLDFAPLARCWLKYSMALVLRNGPSVEVSKVVLDSSDMHAQVRDLPLCWDKCSASRVRTARLTHSLPAPASIDCGNAAPCAA